MLTCRITFCRANIILIGSLLFSGCGGSDSSDPNPTGPQPQPTPTYTVSTSSGIGGSISPESQTIQADGVATFTVTAESGYSIENVNGCNGSLEGNTYTTGAINGNCTIATSFSVDDQTPLLSIENGAEQSFEEQAQVAITAISTPYESNTIESYAWRQTSGDMLIPIAEENTSVLSFTAPATEDRDLSLVFEVTVADNKGNVATALANISIIDIPTLADEVDTDGDGVPDVEDAYPEDFTEYTDTDSDSIGDNADNCPFDSNTSQLDSDLDGIGDVCDQSEVILVNGTFIDAATQGLYYTNGKDLYGTTNVEGSFQCYSGDVVSFSLGENGPKIGEANCDVLVSPLHLNEQETIFTDYVAAGSIARLLQSLDGDQDPSNGITISNDVIQRLENSPEFLFSIEEVFDEQLSTFLQTNDDLSLVSVPRAEAMSHLEASVKSDPNFQSDSCEYYSDDYKARFEPYISIPSCSDYKMLAIFDAYLAPSISADIALIQNMQDGLEKRVADNREATLLLVTTGKQITDTISNYASFDSLSQSNTALARQLIMQSAVIMNEFVDVVFPLAMKAANLDESDTDVPLIKYRALVSQLLKFVLSADKCTRDPDSIEAGLSANCLSTVQDFIKLVKEQNNVSGLSENWKNNANLLLDGMYGLLSGTAVTLQLSQIYKDYKALAAASEFSAIKGKVNQADVLKAASEVKGIIDLVLIPRNDNQTVSNEVRKGISDTLENLLKGAGCWVPLSKGYTFDAKAEACISAATGVTKQAIDGFSAIFATIRLNDIEELRNESQITYKALEVYTLFGGNFDAMQSNGYSLASSWPVDVAPYLAEIAEELDLENGFFFDKYEEERAVENFRNKLVDLVEYAAYDSTSWSSVLSVDTPNRALLNQAYLIDVKAVLDPFYYRNELDSNATGTVLTCFAENSNFERKNRFKYTHNNASNSAINTSFEIEYNTLGQTKLECDVRSPAVGQVAGRILSRLKFVVDVVEGEDGELDENTVKVVKGVSFNDIKLARCVQQHVDDGDVDSLSEISVLACPELGINTLEGLEYLTGLQSLDLSGNEFTAIELSPFTNLKTLTLTGISLSTLDLQSNAKLENVIVSGTSLQSINTQGLTQLTDLYIEDTSINALNLSDNSSLETLTIIQSPLLALDLKNNVNLKELQVEYTGITSLDLSNNQVIETVIAGNNAIEFVDVNNNASLTTLALPENAISSIDLSGNPALVHLELQSNLLEALDLSNNTALSFVVLEANNIADIDISNNTQLTLFNISRNSLTNIAVSAESPPVTLRVQENFLTQAALDYLNEIEDANSLLWIFDDVGIPELLAVSPLEAPIGVTTTFTLSGIQLNEVEAVTVDDATCSNMALISDTQLSIDCYRETIGEATLHAYLFFDALLVEQGERTVTFVANAEPLPPTFTSLSPMTVTAGQTDVLFTVTGENFTSDLAMAIHGVSECGDVEVDTATYQQATITCDIPFTSEETMAVYIKDITEGTRIAGSEELTITVIQPEVNVTDGYDYPIGDRGRADGMPYQFNEQLSPSLNNAYTFGEGVSDNHVRDNEYPDSSKWFNIQDVGSFLDFRQGLHSGEDWNIKSGNDDAGQPVYAIANGKVIRVSQTYQSSIDTGGWTIVLEHVNPDNTRVYSIYSHVTSIDQTEGTLVRTAAELGIVKGQLVERGEMIARLSKDISFPSHLHFEVRTLPPAENGSLWSGAYQGYFTPTGQAYPAMTAAEVSETFALMQNNYGIVDGSDYIDFRRAGINARASFVTAAKPIVGEVSEITLTGTDLPLDVTLDLESGGNCGLEYNLTETTVSTVCEFTEKGSHRVVVKTEKDGVFIPGSRNLTVEVTDGSPAIGTGAEITEVNLNELPGHILVLSASNNGTDYTIAIQFNKTSDISANNQANSAIATKVGDSFNWLTATTTWSIAGNYLDINLDSMPGYSIPFDDGVINVSESLDFVLGDNTRVEGIYRQASHSINDLEGHALVFLAAPGSLVIELNENNQSVIYMKGSAEKEYAQWSVDADLNRVDITTNDETLYQIHLDDETEPFTERLISPPVGDSYVWQLLQIVDSNNTEAPPEEPVASTESFNMVWRVEAGQTLIIPTQTGYNYDYQIDWGDGSEIEQATGNTTHVYNEAGDYTVKISGVFEAFVAERFDSICDQNNALLMDIAQWGDISWKTFEYAFSHCIFLSSSAEDVPDLTYVNSLAYMFERATRFRGDLRYWKTSNIVNTSYMFSNTEYFNGEIGQWDTSNITDMRGMFNSANSFNSDISQWDTSKVSNLSYMFQHAISFNGDVSQWDTSLVTEMQGLFAAAWSFNGDISKWNTSSVVDMMGMFASTKSFNGDISRWDTSKVRNMSYMFYSSSSFNGDISQWDTSNVSDMSGMFSVASGFNGDISQWDTGNVTDMSNMFRHAANFNGDISQWDTSNVTNMMAMFYYATSFNGDVSQWDTSKVTNMDEMFSNAANFKGDLSGWNVNSVTSNNLFSNGLLIPPIWVH